MHAPTNIYLAADTISIHHEKVHKFYTPDEFKFLYDQCVEIGFKMVSSSPLTRSSYHADEDFAKLKQNRINSH